MIPLCLIVGDSTTVGTAAALAAAGMRCEVHARVGATSGEVLRSHPGMLTADRAVIALGSNDLGNPKLRQNLGSLRSRISAARVTWLVPYAARVAWVVNSVSAAFGDEVLPLSMYRSFDRLHPANYGSVAAGILSEGRSRSGQTIPSVSTPTARRSSSPAGRRAVVLNFSMSRNPSVATGSAGLGQLPEVAPVNGSGEAQR